jgi:hypothetical protein
MSASTTVLLYYNICESLLSEWDFFLNYIYIKETKVQSNNLLNLDVISIFHILITCEINVN